MESIICFGYKKESSISDMTMRRKLHNAYLYPLTNRLSTGIYNPYLDNFMAALSGQLDFVNRNHPSNTGTLNILRFLPGIRFVFLNWIENLPEKKAGLLQTVFLFFLLHTKKIFGLKIIWTLHNKISHSANKLFLKKMIFRQVLKNSDLVITHSEEGIQYAENFLKGVSDKIFFFPHPIVPQQPLAQHTKEFDILIWGTLAPYKGILEFLEYLYAANLQERYKILIVGKSLDQEYFRKIKNLENSNITIRNQFISDKELKELVSKSKIILFTYSGNSVLSSGALIDSIAYHANVIGPEAGAFREMGKSGLIYTYKTFSQLPDIINNLIQSNNESEIDAIKKFIKEHSWNKFAEALEERLKVFYQ